MTKLWDLIIESAEKGRMLQRKDGSMPAGHNGPHNDQETPVRNTAHWCITFLKVFEWTEKKEFRESAEKAADYLISKETRPMNATFWCRKNPKKDFSNGLIGQAWVIEALVFAAKILDDIKYQEIAEEVFLIHPFDQEKNLWRVVNVDGSNNRIKMTFNQQIWFSIVGTYLVNNRRNEIIQKRLNLFLSNLPKIFNINKIGFINHRIEINKRSFKNLVKNTLTSSYQEKEEHPQTIGYHSFSLYGLSILRNLKINLLEDYWLDVNVKKALQLISKDIFRELIKNDSFSFSYNPTGFEVAYTILSFKDLFKNSEDLIKKWLFQQISEHYSLENNLMCKNTDDPKVLMARFYEIFRIIDLKKDFMDLEI